MAICINLPELYVTSTKVVYLIITGSTFYPDHFVV